MAANWFRLARQAYNNGLGSCKQTAIGMYDQ